MLQRDIAFCQEVANFVADEQSPFRYVHLRTDENYQYIEACNGKLMLCRRVEKQGSGFDDCYKVLGKVQQYREVNQMQSGDYLIGFKGYKFAERIPNIKYPHLDKQSGEKGAYKATFERESFFRICRDFCSYRFTDIEPELTFTLTKCYWKIFGVKGNNTPFNDEMPINITDTIVNEGFKFRANAKHLRLLSKWFEGEDIVFHFQNIAGAVTKKIQVTPTDSVDWGKTAVIVPKIIKE